MCRVPTTAEGDINILYTCSISFSYSSNVLKYTLKTVKSHQVLNNRSEKLVWCPINQSFPTNLELFRDFYCDALDIIVTPNHYISTLVIQPDNSNGFNKQSEVSSCSNFPNSLNSISAEFCRQQPRIVRVDVFV